jgi:hypothetical protein
MTAATNASKHAEAALVGLAQFTSVWRRTVNEARTDRLVTALVGLFGSVVGAAAALFASSTTVAVYIGLVSLCVTPGCALVCWLPTRERLTRVVTVIAASLTWTVLVTSALAWTQITSLGVLLITTVGVGGIGSGAFLGIELKEYLQRMPDTVPAGGSEDPAWQPDEGGLDPGSVAASRRSHVPKFILICALEAAAGLTAIAVHRARGQVAGNYGLLPVLGVPFLVAVVLTIGVLLVVLRLFRTVWPAAVMSIGLLLVEFNATPMMIAATPLGSSAYKHFGVVDYILHGGVLSNPLDIYQQWPGFFAAAAGLARLSGRGPLSYANWAQLFFEALNAVVIFAIASRLSRGNRVAPYIAVLLFETANWEGTFYYSPQTMAFTLSLFFQFVLLSLLEPARLRRPFRLWFSIPQLEICGKERTDALGMAAQTLGFVALFGAIIITHQLSPYFVFAGVISLWALGVFPHPRIVLIFVVMLVTFDALHLPAIDHNQLLTGFHLSNVTGTASLLPTSAQEALSGVLAKVISVGFWSVTAVCVLSCRRNLGTIAIPSILAATPLMFTLVTNYDGEAIYRVFLFSSPWCAVIIARRLASLIRSSIIGWAAVGIWALFAALGSAQSQSFGSFSMEQVPSAEISASSYFLDHAPPNSEIVTVAAENFPGRLNGRYVLHNATQTQNDPSLDGSSKLIGYGLERISPKDLAKYVAQLAGGSGYLVIAPSMETYINYYAVYAPGTLPTLEPRLEHSRYWQVWYENDAVLILRAWPEGKA